MVEALGVTRAGAADVATSRWRTLGARAAAATLPFQEFMIVERAEGPIEGVELRGLERARPTDAVLPGARARPTRS